MWTIERSLVVEWILLVSCLGPGAGLLLGVICYWEIRLWKGRDS